MKTLRFTFTLTLLAFTLALFANTQNTTSTTSNCVWKSWFKYPKNNTTYQEGKAIYVRVDAQKYQHIQSMELYVNGKFIRKETQYPYEWCKGSGNSDSYLRKLKQGTYKLKCRIKDKCGKYHEIYCTIYVKCQNNGGGKKCVYNGGFKYPEEGKYYQKGSDIYVLFDAKGYHNIAYCELYLNGKFVRKETQYPYEWAKGQGNNDGYLRNLKAGTYKLKCRVYDKCGHYKDFFRVFHVKGNPGVGQCNYQGYFKHPENGKYYNAGSHVYVLFQVKNYQNVAYCELYVNGKMVRKETQYPYEWCKGSGNSDSYLRNLKPGTYKLKCRVYDKCGKFKDFYCTFYVKGGNGDNGHCKYKSWFKYPKNNGTYKYGDDVYVRVDTERYQDIAEMHLFVNGKFVRKETQYPYEWCKGSGNSDGYLRNLKRGTYNLKCQIKTKCGKWHEIYCKFYVK